MDPVRGAFSYRISRLDGVARLDVSGQVSLHEVEPMLAALMRTYAERRFPPGRVLLDVAPAPDIEACA